MSIKTQCDQPFIQHFENRESDYFSHSGRSVAVDSTDIPSGGRQVDFVAKQLIYRDGNQVDRIYLIRKGLVKLLSYLPNGRARIVRLHARDHWFGLEGLVNQPYEHTAIAIGDVQTYCVSRNDLRNLEHNNPRLFAQILAQAYRHLSQADCWIADLSTGGIKPRVARMIDFLSRLEYGESSNMVELLTVHEMADMLGVTSESVSRILAEFKRNDLLYKPDACAEERYAIDSRQLRREALQ